MNLEEKLKNTEWKDSPEEWKEKFTECFYQEISDPQLLNMEENANCGWGEPWKYTDSKEYFLPDPEEAAKKWAEICIPQMEDEIYQYADEKTIHCEHCDIILPETNKDYRCLYKSQYQYQSAHLELDFENRTVMASYNAEIGGAVPISVYYGTCDTVGFDYQIDLQTLRSLMTDMAPLFDQAFASYTEEIRDGHVCGYYDPAIRDTIEYALQNQYYSREEESPAP